MTTAQKPLVSRFGALTKAKANLAGIMNSEVIPLDLACPTQSTALSMHSQYSRPRCWPIRTAVPEGRNGYEIRFTTTHLGHFQLTARLWNALNNFRRCTRRSLLFHWYKVAGVDFSVQLPQAAT